jgi:hypothetical protein
MATLRTSPRMEIPLLSSNLVFINKILDHRFLLIFMVKQSAILIFKVICQCQKIIQNFTKKIFIEEFKKERPSFSNDLFSIYFIF